MGERAFRVFLSCIVAVGPAWMLIRCVYVSYTTVGKLKTGEMAVS